MRIADYSVTKAVLERHGFTFKKSFGQKFRQGTNTWANFNDIDLVINLSCIYNLLKDIGISQKILPEGLFKGKTVTL